MDTGKREKLKQKIKDASAKRRTEEILFQIGNIINLEDEKLTPSPLEQAHKIRSAVQGCLIACKNREAKQFESEMELLTHTKTVLTAWHVEHILIGALQDEDYIPLIRCPLQLVLYNLRNFYRILARNIVISALDGANTIILELDHYSSGDVYTFSVVQI